MYVVLVKKKAQKRISKAPHKVQDLFKQLLQDLQKTGPIQQQWPNFSSLEENNFHCHLNYSYVVCWKNENNTIKIEVYYAGSREDAPY
jgi:mRNA-degrading endonuclease RelE of RelBE toxin-antitoxin system